MSQRVQSTVFVVLVLGVALLAFRDPDYGEWGVPHDVNQAFSRIGDNIADGVQYVDDLVRGKNREMQQVHDHRMDRNDSRIERSGGKGR